MQGRYDSSWLDEMPKAQANRILREAKAAGIVTTGRYYMSGLADKRGHCDPKAWIDGAADIRRVAKERNLHVRGIVDYTPPEQPPPERPAISKRLERELVAKERRRNPRLSKGEAREMVIDKYAPSFKKKKT
jgi:hypothetical protein